MGRPKKNRNRNKKYNKNVPKNINNKVEKPNIDSALEETEILKEVVTDDINSGYENTEQIQNVQVASIPVKPESEEVKEDLEKEMTSKELEQKKDTGKIKPYFEKGKMSKKKKLIIWSVVSFIILSILLSLCIIVSVNKMNKNVYSNVHIYNTDISGKTSEELTEILNQISDVQKEEKKVDVYQGTQQIHTTKATDIDFVLDIETTVKNVLSFGRTGNFLRDNAVIVKAWFCEKEIKPVYKYDSVKLEDNVKNIDLTIKDRFVNDAYSVDEKTNKLVISKGKSGNSIDYEKEKSKIVDALSYDLLKIDLELITKKPTSLDVSQVHAEVKKDPQDAYINNDVTPAKFVSEKVGYDFSVSELEKKLEEPGNQAEGKTVEFALKVIEPKVKLADITYMLYKDKLSGYTTYFDGVQSPRANNINIALKYLNGKIIMPGEVFSYNKAIGDVNHSKGYQPAATFKGGTIVDEVGGGICQTTSTLYNVALMSNLEIVERHQHGLPVGYVPPSRDATVYSPVLDFKFKNNRKYPIKIVTSFSPAGNMNISIFGTKEEVEYEVLLSNKVLGSIAFTTKYEYDTQMPEGKQVIISAGVNGYTSESYITKKLNGAVVSQNLLSKDTYKAQQQIVKVGTAKTQ